MPAVSVIMPVYNGERYLAEAIDSILAQTFADFELLIVDDGSQDSSLQIIRDYASLDDRIQVIPSECNLGPADARNLGIQRAIGDYITTMDCDDISLPQRLQMQVDFLESNAEVGAVGTGGQAMNEDLKELLFELNVPEKHCQIVLAKFVHVGFIYATIMTRCAIMRAIGGYQPVRRSGEERLLYWRMLWEARTRFANIPENLYTYRRHEQSLSANRDAKLQAEADEVLTMMLRRLWGEAPQATLSRFRRMAMGQELNWRERRAAMRDMTRLIEAIASAGLVEADETPCLRDAINQRLEQASPRRWQQFMHWRRHRLGF